MTASYDLGVHASHYKRRGPGFRIFPVFKAGLVTTVRSVALAFGVQAVRLNQCPGDRTVRAAFFDQVHHAGKSAATRCTFGGFHEHADRLAVCAVFLMRRFLQKPNTDIHGHGIEATAMHDLCASFFSSFVVRVNHFPNPLHFTRQVTIVRPGIDAGGNEIRAVQCIRANGRQNDARAFRQSLQRVFVEAVGNDDLEFTGIGTETIANVMQLFLATTRQRPAQIIANPVLPEQVLSDQGSRETRSPLNNDVEFAGFL